MAIRPATDLPARPGADLPADPVDLATLAALPPTARLDRLGTAARGLTEAEAAARLQRCGPNEPVAPERRRVLVAFLANFTHTLALLLWFAAGLAFAAGIPELGGAIVAVVAINGVFAFFQEHRAEQAVAALMRRVAVQARVVRDGRERLLPAMDLVPGDVIRLAAGDVVPADCLLLETDNLTVDLSLITGESAPAARDAEPVVADGVAPAELACFAPAGSAVVTGLAEAVVRATGPASTLGEIAGLVQGMERGQSLLERQVAQLSRVTAVIAVLTGTATLALAGLLTDTTFLLALTFATGVIVALVPEGLLPTLSVALAIGARRMAERGAAVRRLAAVEIVGSVTTICTDKTGTLTENALAVRGFVGADGEDGPSRGALLVAALCGDARPFDGDFTGDPVDVALARWAGSLGADLAALRSEHPRLADVPFTAERRYMRVTCPIDGTSWDLVKGAPEAVFALIGAAPSPALGAALADAVADGERVLLLAAGPSGQPPRIAGLVRLHDPLRSEVPAALAAGRRAGVRVVMLTGDHPATARAVAQRAALGANLPVIEGPEVDSLSDAQLLERIRAGAIFARTTPREKLRIVSALRASGEVVVVTGDGINDAPALRAADVGVAMGRRGTEVAKQAADVVLADDNFATIVAAVEEGRAIKANIRRFVSYVFTSNVAEVVPYLAYLFLPIPLPLTILQVLAIDLGTDLLPALALGVEPASARAMARPPESPRAPLLGRGLAIRTFLFYGLIEAALGLASFFGYYLVAGWRPFGSFDPYEAIAPEAATATLLGIVAGQVGCLVAQRDGPLFARLSLRSNPWIAWGLLFELSLTLALVYVPGLNRLFGMAAVEPVWLLLLPVGAALFILLDLVRRACIGNGPWLSVRPGSAQPAGDDTGRSDRGQGTQERVEAAQPELVYLGPVVGVVAVLLRIVGSVSRNRQPRWPKLSKIGTSRNARDLVGRIRRRRTPCGIGEARRCGT
jgi:sodium/potassium-transporting ATPase subunit alpha